MLLLLFSMLLLALLPAVSASCTMLSTFKTLLPAKPRENEALDTTPLCPAAVSKLLSLLATTADFPVAKRRKARGRNALYISRVILNEVTAA